MPSKHGFLEEWHTIPHDFESPSRARREHHVRSGKVFRDLGRQTDGSGFVLSERAVFDRDIHEALFEFVKYSVTGQPAAAVPGTTSGTLVHEKMVLGRRSST